MVQDNISVQRYVPNRLDIGKKAEIVCLFEYDDNICILSKRNGMLGRNEILSMEWDEF